MFPGLDGIETYSAGQQLLLMLCGEVFDHLERVEQPTQKQREASQALGYSRLKQLTNQDFGFDLLKWYTFLLTDDQPGMSLTYPISSYHKLRDLLLARGISVPWKKDLCLKRARRRARSPEETKQRLVELRRRSANPSRALAP